MSQPDYDVDKILDMAVGEFGARLADEQRRERMSDAVLGRLLDAANKAAERRDALNKETSERPLDPLEVILDSPLSSKRKKELIVLEIKGHEAEIARLYGAIEGDDPEDE